MPIRIDDAICEDAAIALSLMMLMTGMNGS